MLSALAMGSLTISELIADAREPMLARPMLMHLLWVRDALADLSGPIDEETIVWRVCGWRHDGTGVAAVRRYAADDRRRSDHGHLR